MTTNVGPPAELELDNRRVFISYSRSETTLVEDLADGLRARGVRTFLDFRDLAPGGAWDDQLTREMADARAALVLVSDRSIWETRNTQNEWRQGTDLGKHVVLAIADPVPLPAPLAGRPFVDLRRGRFERRIDEVAKLLESPQEWHANRPPPGPGWRRPFIVWFAVVLAIAAALLSLLFFWTVALPLILLPLPFRILQRSFDYARVRLTLLTELLLLTIYIAGMSLTSLDILAVVSAVGLLPVSVLLLVLRSTSFRRWMQPVASRPRIRRLPAVSPWDLPRRQRFVVHAAPQDKRYVDDVVAGLEARRFRHECRQRLTGTELPTADARGYDLVLRFVSKFNDRAETEPGVLTLPVLLSEPDEQLPMNLQRTQWIEFRHGGRRRQKRAIEHLAASFDQPAEILRRLGASPPFRTRLLPRGVRVLHDILASLVVLVGATVVIGLVSRAVPKGTTKLEPVSVGAYVNMGVAMFVFVAMTGLLLDRLANRRPTRRFGLYLPVLFVVMVWTMVALTTVTRVKYESVGSTTSDALAQVADGLATFLLVIVVFGFPILSLATRREVSMWVPRVKERDGVEESPWRALVGSIGLFGRAVAQATRDALGVTLRAGLQRRRSRGQPAPDAHPDVLATTVSGATSRDRTRR